MLPDLAGEARVCANAYQFFADLFNTPIPASGDEYITFLVERCAALTDRGSAYSAEAIEELRKFVEQVRGADAADKQVELARERTRLVRGILPEYGPRPPYEAVYRGLWAPERLLEELIRVYEGAGARLDPSLGERADYIGVELDFMAYLANEEADAWERGDRARAAERIEYARRFLQDHLSTWVPSYVKEVLAHTRHPFFRATALLLADFLRQDLATRESLLADLGAVFR